MYIIIELQTTDGVTSNIVQTREEENEALSVYHRIMSFAATSEVEHHAAVVMDEDGRYVARGCYVHKKKEIPLIQEEPQEVAEDGSEES